MSASTEPAAERSRPESTVDDGASGTDGPAADTTAPDTAAPGTAATAAPHRDRRALATALTVLLVAVCGGVAVAAALGDDGFWRQGGLPVPADGVRIAGILARVAAVAGMALAAGSLLVAGFVAPPQASGTVGVQGYRALRRGALAALLGGLAAIAAGWLSVAETTGTGLGDLAGAGPFGWLAPAATLDEPMGWALAGFLLLLVAAGAAFVLGWKAAAALGLVASATAVIPSAVHPAATGMAHDWSGDGVMIRSVAGVVFLGVAAALAAYRLHGGSLSGTPARRGRALLIGAGTLYLIGEIVFQVVTIWTGPLTGSAYTRTVAGTAVLLVPLVIGTGLLARALGSGSGARGAGRLLPVLALAGGLVAALGVAGTRLVPPRFVARPDTAFETLIGWNFEQPFSAVTMLVEWRWNILFGTGALLLAGLYAAGVRRLAGRGVRWPVGRTWAWMLGCAALLFSTSSGLGYYSPAMFSVHMISHMSLNMLTPILLAMGGAVTLALRVLRPAGRDQQPGPREWVLAAVHSPVARVMTHPAFAAVLFVSSFYILYFTPLFDVALRFHWTHQLMNLHFVLIGYLFFWPLIGVDAAPHRLPHLGRLAVLLATMPFHAFFGIAVMSSSDVLGYNFYSQVGLPWLDLLDDQKVGGGIAWATGELPMLLVMVTLVVQWSRADSREAVRTDRQAERDDDADLKAYNEMLAKLRQGG
ncbi:cytochrome c oxidase assembly protein [Pseudonocardia parietis]|uniref:Copper resistance protein D n=1 Tax=Pseudonocardia parietis TaxID=570936 RepID=A0ABS4VKP5_9PSEU|nr:cytochrome c oxidase assembly protein [Pseudonocardia parietis]MBP2364499.1 putative copper resistance protein D [Pseudonocardia parietis]